MRISKYLEMVENVKNGDGTFSGRCPAHNDNRNSLSITEGTDGRILLYCHAGCSTENIVAAMGLTLSDLYNDEPQKAKRISVIYPYRDLAGNVLHETIRYEPKGFAQRRPDGCGGSIYNLQGIETVIYKLPEVTEAIKEGKTVFIVEGEKDVENMWKLNLAATTSPMGAGKWKDYYSDYLKGANIIILPDHDEPGKKHAQNVAASLFGKAQSVKIVELPGLDEKGDVTDFFRVNGNIKGLELLQDVIDNAEVWEIKNITLEPTIHKAIEESSQTLCKQYKRTDLGNAERLVARHGRDIRYCHTWNKWLIWSDTHWKIDDTGEIERRAKDTIRSIYEEVTRIQDEDQRKGLVNHAARSESNRAINAMVDLAKSELEIPVTSDEMDTDIWLLNCKNGTLDLRTGELKLHDRKDLITKLIAIEYNPIADSVEWIKFLNKIMGCNHDLIKFLQRAVGYSLTGNIWEQCLFILYGNGANGKSTFLDVISSLLGEYGQQTPVDTLMVKDNSGISNDIARLKGARFVVASEVEEGKRLAESLIKQLTGGEKITARFMRAEFFEFLPQFKLWLGTNHKPTIRGTDHAIWRRIKLVPFKVTIPPKERDKALLEKLKAELPGILAWAVEGCQEWHKNGLGEPQEVIVATEGYKNEMDIITRFVNDCCDINTKLSTKSSQLYKVYVEWCKQNGEYELSQTKFSLRMVEKGFIKETLRTGVIWYNIAIFEELDADENSFANKRCEGC